MPVCKMETLYAVHHSLMSCLMYHEARREQKHHGPSTTRIRLVGRVLRHISHYKLFNAKSCLNIYIKYMICKHILYISFLNEPELIFYTQLKSFKYISVKYE